LKIGFIGLGGMGQFFKNQLMQAGHECFGFDPVVSSSEPNVEGLIQKSDIVLFSVPIHKVAEVVRECGQHFRGGQIILSQSGVKTIEHEAFQKYLDKDVALFLIHAMHGPSVSAKGEVLLKIKVNASVEQEQVVNELLKGFQYKLYDLESAEQHDKETADTQALTHLCFLSMGLTWKNMNCYPWETDVYSGGLDNLKALLTLRIFAGQGHVYADLATLNPYVKDYAKTYLQQVDRLLGMDQASADGVTCDLKEYFQAKQPLLDEQCLNQYKLGTGDIHAKANSHLSLLAMALTWREFGVRPFSQYLSQTPPYKIRLGLVEYLFRNEALLQQSVQALVQDNSIRKDDEAFRESVQQWTSYIENKQAREFEQLFTEVKTYFNDRLGQAKQKSDELISFLKQSS
jgi:prephenate dehydrogenase (NADP+)